MEINVGPTTTYLLDSLKKEFNKKETRDRIVNILKPILKNVTSYYQSYFLILMITLILIIFLLTIVIFILIRNEKNV